MHTQMTSKERMKERKISRLQGCFKWTDTRAATNCIVIP